MRKSSAGKPIKADTRFSGFYSQSSMNFRGDAHDEFSTILFSCNWFGHGLAAFLHINNSIRDDLSNPANSGFRRLRKPT